MTGVTGRGLPAALLLDLDDTILDDSGGIADCWAEACAAHAAELPAADSAELHRTIARVSRWYWGDTERHREGRLKLNDARREVVRMAFAELGLPDASVADRVADDYAARRDAGLAPIEDAIETVEWLRRQMRRLALLTNGAAAAQRAKIERFGLAPHFEVILIEGELGFGKPDPRVYERALAALGATPAECWMVGDNLEWDVAAPQRLGIRGIWIDARGHGLPKGHAARPDRVIRKLADLRNGESGR